MSHNNRFWRFALTVGFLIIPVTIEAARPYVLTSLIDFQSAIDWNSATDINNRGQVVGWNATTTANRAFLWSPASPNGTAGEFVDLGDLQGGNSDSFATGINSRGQVVGVSGAKDGNQAFLWTPTQPNGKFGSLVGVGDLPGGIEFSFAHDVNELGQVVGQSNTFEGPRPFLWSPTTPNGTSGSMVNLGNPPSRTNSSIAYAINRKGQIAGQDGDVPGGAFLWTPDTPNGAAGASTNLGILGMGFPESHSGATGINSVGQVVGTSPVGMMRFHHAFLWTPNTPNGNSGSMTDLGALVGTNRSSFARDINSHGQIVGASTAGRPVAVNSILFDTHAFLWTPDTLNGESGSMVDLNSFLSPNEAAFWRLTNATAINDAGQIVGIALFDVDGPDGLPPTQRAFLLTPIPEPSTFSLAGFAGMFLWSCARSQRVSIDCH